MSSIHVTPEGLAEIVNRGLMAEFQEELRKRLMAVSEKVAREVAADFAAGLKGKVVSYNNVQAGQVQMILSIDGVKREVA